MAKKTSYTHVKGKDGKPVVKAEPRGSTSKPAQFKENIIIGAIARKLFRW